MDDLLQSKIYRFDGFELDAGRRALAKNGETIALGSKALDLLIVFVANNGRVLDKNELLEAVWPDQFVEENNLTVQVSALRKVLGANLISTIPGRGYSFVAAVEQDQFEDEIVIENRTIERIVIEDSYEETDIPRQLAGRARTNYRIVALISVAATVLVLGTLGFFYARSGASADTRALKLTKITSSGDVTIATITPDGKYAVYARREKDGESLWLRQIASGSQQQILSSRPVRFIGLAVTPDGNSIYTTVFSPNLPDNPTWRLPLLGGAVEEIGGIKTGVTLSFSPDGSQIAFTESRSSKKETQLLIANSDGTNKRIVSHAADDTRSFPNFAANPVAWSPDGKAIACSVGDTASGTGYRILLIDPQDGNERSITDKRLEYVDHLVWIDNENLAFIEYSIGPSLGQVWSVSRSTGEVKRITNDLSSHSWLGSAGGDLLAIQTNKRSHVTLAGFDEKTAEVSPRQIFDESGSIDNVAFASDGSIVFSSSSSGNREIWRVDPDGSNPRRLTVNANATYGLTISPVDDSIVFCSAEDGKYVLKHMNPDGSGLSRITDGPEDVHPEFAHDGRSVVYQKGIYNKVVTLWRFSLENKTSAPLVQTFAAKPSISRDGSKIAYYFMDQDDGGVWKIGLASAMDGSFIGKLSFPRPVTERRMRWHPDGTAIGQIIYEGDEIKLMLMSTKGGEPKIVSGLGKGNVNWFDWSRDGKQLVISHTDQQQDIVYLSR